MQSQIDHLVVMASSLAQGVQWCEATLGITPGPGGEHPLYGTHNRLFKIATPSHPLAYLEIIAIDPSVARSPKSRTRRWFDMDEAALQAAVASAPRLLHFVAQTPDIQAARQALKDQGIDRGPAVQANRRSRKGVLQWQITVRDDGQRLFDGALPSLIQWGKPDAAEPLRLHPRNTLPRSGVTLQSIQICHPAAAKLQAAYEAIGLAGVGFEVGAANVTATLNTPKGVVALCSQGL